METAAHPAAELFGGWAAPAGSGFAQPGLRWSGPAGPARSSTGSPGCVRRDSFSPRFWWSPSNDHPSDKATFAIGAIVAAGLRVISNGWSSGAGRKANRWPPIWPSSRLATTTSSAGISLWSRLAAYGHGLDSQLAHAACASVEPTLEVIDFLSGIFEMPRACGTLAPPSAGGHLLAHSVFIAGLA
jgi:hypothetical protein